MRVRDMKSNPIKREIFVAVAMLPVAAVLVGCGNLMPLGLNRAPAGSFSDGALLGGEEFLDPDQFEEGDFLCPSRENIRSSNPSQDQAPDYVGCAHRESDD